MNETLSASAGAEENDNPYLQVPTKKEENDQPKPEYVVQKGDSLMKVAYMHNIR